MRRTFFVLLTFWSSTAFADPKPGDEGTPEFEAATKLVKQLSAARYAAREAAAKQLLEMRATAIPALTTGASSPDEEVRNRCKSLLPQVIAADWKSRAEAFLAEPDGSHKDDPILFADYQKVVGKLDDSSRKLFEAMLRADMDLFVLAVLHPEAVDDHLKERCRKLSKQADKGYVPVRGTVGELATMFFLHERKRTAKSPWGGGEHPAHQLANPGLADGMATDDVGPAVRRIVVAWAERRPADDMAGRSLFIMNAGRNAIPEAVPLLAQLAKDKQVPRNYFYEVRFAATWALGQIRTPEAIAALKELLPDRTLTLPVGKKGTATLGDSALAALAHACGKTSSDYGLVTEDQAASIPLRVTGGGPPISLKFYWFPNEVARQDGLEKFKSDAENPSPKPGR